jgi:hypothetical protein
MAGNGKHYSAKIINTSALLFHSAFDTTALFDEATQQGCCDYRRQWRYGRAMAKRFLLKVLAPSFR